VSSAISRVRGAVSSGLSAVRGAFSSGFAAARGVVTGAMSSIRSAVSNGIGRVVSLVRSLPGRIRGALGGLGSVLFSSGTALIDGFASGIRAAIGRATSAASSAVSAVRNFFPFSPAKEGPFSGSGYTTFSGEALMKDFAKSMDKTARSLGPQLTRALDPFAQAVPSVVPRSATPATPAATGGTATGGGVDMLVQALAMLFARLQLNVTLGRDRRTTAEWWLDGQQLAAQLG
jgi:phage-related protein